MLTDYLSDLPKTPSLQIEGVSVREECGGKRGVGGQDTNYSILPHIHRLVLFYMATLSVFIYLKPETLRLNYSSNAT